MADKIPLGQGLFKNSNGTYGIFMGSFPEKLAIEWEKDCQENYGGCRWAKVYSDHCKARQMEVEEFAAEIMDKQQQESIKEEEPKKEEEVLTIGQKGGEENG